ncbi:MAG: Histidine-tRNA ligase [Parcubacteria group bacterium GW2011_GWA1_40_21]|nr:MAG: Histidine-tRNA ligase [Parcubacteria group bacterium GW2011_GWC1_40_13]KKR54049.1 MAG: Histidine-tRNA ligase [Parcubacteria group bacterium GW2011_GWA1_40_21]
MSNFLKPEAISGFPEWLPEERILEQSILDMIRENFEKYGFVPIETSAVEKTAMLIAKGSNDREIYTLGRLSNYSGDNDQNLALHFDLTVPLARYVVQNYGLLSFPFRRYQIQKVWRGERPQSGRFREFYQCDIDVVGDRELPLLVDAEMPSVIYQIFKQMNIGKFMINVNNKKILQGYFSFYGLSSHCINEAMHAIDKLEKVGVAETRKTMAEKGIGANTIDDIINFASINKSINETMEYLRSCKVDNELFLQGVDELEQVIGHMNSLGIPQESYKINLGIVRGLDYYTGTIYETTLIDYPGIGSICSGGRYDNLTSFFGDKKMPGVGISIGLTRLFSQLLKAGIIKTGPSTTALVLITSMDKNLMSYYFNIATLLRDSGIKTEVYFDSKKLGDQLKYASKKGFRFAIIAGNDEVNKNSVQIKNLETGEQNFVNLNDVCSEVSKIM